MAFLRLFGLFEQRPVLGKKAMESRKINEVTLLERLDDIETTAESDFWTSQAQRLKDEARRAADPDYRAAARKVAALYERLGEPASTKQAATFQEAFDAAAANFSTEEWDEMPPAHRSAAIYAEMRRIDAERFGVAEPLPPSSRAPVAA